jgi:hypothetical protein
LPDLLFALQDEEEQKRNNYNYYEAETQGFSYFAAITRPIETPVPTPQSLHQLRQQRRQQLRPLLRNRSFRASKLSSIAGLLVAAYLLRRKN